MTITEFCKENTKLENMQVQLLERIGTMIPFAASVSRQEVIFYTYGANNKILVLETAGSCEHTKKNFSKFSKINSLELPLWAKIFSDRTVLTGKHEQRLGKFADLTIFPIIDNAGKIIAGIAFIDVESNENNFLLAETAHMAIMVPDINHKELYRPISYQSGLIIFDDGGIILYASQTAKHIITLMGFDRRLIGTSVYGSRLKLSFVKQSLAKRQGDEMEEIYDDIVLCQRIIPIIFGGKVCRSYLILQDKTQVHDAKQKLLVQNSMIKEIHHRVKNNLQSISGLLRMQARRSKSDEVKSELMQSIARIESISLVHHMLCNYSEDMVELHTICQELLRLLTVSMLAPSQKIETHYEGDIITLTSEQATYVALVVNELISNAFKHGFKSKKSGKLILHGTLVDEQTVKLQAIDDGNGLGKDFDINKNKNLGMQIMVNVVTSQLNGSIDFINNTQGGCTVNIKFERRD